MPNSIRRIAIALSQVSKTIAIACLSVAAFIAGSPPAMADDDGGIRLVTQNMYVGSSFDALTTAQTPQQVLAAVATIYNNILASKPAERAAAMAREIARHRPDLVALQEAAMLRTGNGGPATTVRSDLLQSLLDELAGLGRHYRAVAIVPGDSMPRCRARLDSTSASPIRMPFWSAATSPMISRSQTCKSSNLGSSFRCRPSSVPSPIRAGGRPSTSRCAATVSAS